MRYLKTVLFFLIAMLNLFLGVFVASNTLIRLAAIWTGLFILAGIVVYYAPASADMK